MSLNGRVTRTATSEVPERDAFAYWRDMISRTFVPLSAEPMVGDRFRGRIDHVAVGSVEISSVVASAQEVRRTRNLVASSDGEFVLCSLQIRGRGMVEQDRRQVLLKPGDLTFYDSTRPYALSFEDAFEQLVVQVPRSLLLSSRTDPRGLTARRVPRDGLGAPVGGFFRGLATTLEHSPRQAQLALPQAIGLLRAAIESGAEGRDHRTASSSEHTYTQVVDFLRAHVADAALDATSIACAFHLSRRSLYRLFADESGAGVMSELRRLRIERATELLNRYPDRPVAAVAHACGFESESAFHRAFRAATGTTPRAR